MLGTYDIPYNNRSKGGVNGHDGYFPVQPHDEVSLVFCIQWNMVHGIANPIKLYACMLWCHKLSNNYYTFTVCYT